VLSCPADASVEQRRSLLACVTRAARRLPRRTRPVLSVPSCSLSFLPSLPVMHNLSLIRGARLGLGGRRITAMVRESGRPTPPPAPAPDPPCLCLSLSSSPSRARLSGRSPGPPLPAAAGVPCPAPPSRRLLVRVVHNLVAKFRTVAAVLLGIFAQCIILYCLLTSCSRPSPLFSLPPPPSEEMHKWAKVSVGMVGLCGVMTLYNLAFGEHPHGHEGPQPSYMHIRSKP
jgi:hypothetical protein